MNKSSMRSLLWQPRLWIISAAFALWCTLGEYFLNDATKDPSGVAFHGIAAFAVVFLAFLAGSFLLLRIVLALLQMRFFPCKQSSFQLRLIFSLLMTACWLPYVFCIWPGTVSNDSIAQISMWIGLKELTADNPLFQTALTGFFCELGVFAGNIDIGIAAYCMLQTMLAIGLFSSICAEAWKDMPRPAAVLILLYHLLNPILPCYAMCVGKDTSFALAAVWMMLLLYRRLSGKEKCSVRLSIASVLCVLLRNAGMALCAVTLLSVIISEAHGKKVEKNHGRSFVSAPSLALILCLSVWLAFKLICLSEIPAAKASENFSLPLQQVARVAATEGLTQEEQELISGVIDPDLIAQAYNPALSDPVKDLWNQQADQAAVRNFFLGWWKIIRRCPATAISATFHQCCGYLYPGYLHPTKPAFLLGNQYGTQETLPQKYCFSINPRAELLKSKLNHLLRIKPFSWLLTPGLYGWVAVFAFVMCFCRGKNRLWISALPAVLILIGCMLSPVNGYFRYAMPLYTGVGVSMLCCVHSIHS